MDEYKCGDCFHAELCEKSEMLVGFSKDNYAYCSMFLNSADVAPVRHGRWKCNKPCPVCGEDRFKGLDADIWADWKPPYCPNCGAKMDEVIE